MAATASASAPCSTHLPSSHLCQTRTWSRATLQSSSRCGNCPIVLTKNDCLASNVWRLASGVWCVLTKYARALTPCVYSALLLPFQLLTILAYRHLLSARLALYKVCAFYAVWLFNREGVDDSREGVSAHRHRDTDTDTDRQTHRQTDTHTHTLTHTHTHSHSHTHAHALCLSCSLSTSSTFALLAAVATRERPV